MITDLQASLIVIGGAIVVGVISYNKWHEYKARKSVQRAFSSEHDDVLMGAGTTKTPAVKSASADSSAGEARQEPTFSEPRIDSPRGSADVEDGGFGDVLPASPVDAGAFVPTIQMKELPIDELIDCVIPVALEGAQRGEKLLPALQSLKHVANKPIHFIGQRDDGEWEAIAHGSVYSALRAGVQLANRSGALNELEYSEMIMRLRQVTDQLDAEPDVPDMTTIMSTARSLQQFITQYDAQLSVNILSNGAPWAIHTLLTALERQGFDVRPDGRLVMPDGDGGILFTLSTNVTLAAETTNRLTLLLDVPCVAKDRDGFGAMNACARMLAARLDGVIVDDANQPITAQALDEIAGQVEAFYADMANADIAAGSTRALRLFS
ncbi:cell division protein ZipA C-terminal FtsZ-binding domain-containing protein [soil metagenome]